LASLNMPLSSGVPESAIRDTLIAEYNDIESVKHITSGAENEIAAIIVEPIAANMGVVLPEENFLTFLREYTKNRCIVDL